MYSFFEKSKQVYFIIILALVMLVIRPINCYAELADTQDNDYFTQAKIPTGKTGKSMNVSFTFTADRDYDVAWVGIDYTDAYNVTSDEEEEHIDKYSFPFEVSEESMSLKSIGKIKDGQSRTTSISAKVRRDIPEGYYSVKVYVSDSKDGGSHGPSELINIWVTKSTTVDDEEDISKAVTFVLGENQATPYGVYPEVMNFSLNLRNRGKITAQDVTASIVMSKSDDEYPFDINEANYDRHYDSLSYDQTVKLDYSMAIRKDSYSGYYPIKINITYRESSEGELLTQELEFYVHIVNKDKEDDLGDFNINDRIKARIVVDSFHTIPEDVYAGDEFELVIIMKNASSDVSASNLLFAFDSEKISDSAVFTTDLGSNSIVVNSMVAGATTELRMKFLARAGVDQRSYTMTVNEKYDSPEFKNAEEEVDIDIPIKQIAKLNVGTMDIMPESINVGDETNVMFQINNTGKVILYNVMAKFEADSIVKNESYVGNIKPGESGNVDAMIKGLAASSDEGKVKITISYEDENGIVNTEEKEMLLMVNEEIQSDYTDDFMGEELPTEIDLPWYKNIKIIIPLFILLIAVLITIKSIRKKKKSKDIDGDIDEI